MSCCGQWRSGSHGIWIKCAGTGDTDAPTKEQAALTEAFMKMSGKSRKGREWSCVEPKDERASVCYGCAAFVVMAHLQPRLSEATSKQGKMKPRDYLHDVLMISGTHARALKAVDPDSVRRVSKEHAETRIVVAGDADPLPALLALAQPLILRPSFTHSLMVTICRKLLVEAGFVGHGRSPFSGCFEGEDVKRFCVWLYAFYPSSLFDALRGSATAKGQKWDVREKNCIWVVHPRELRRLIASPYPIISALTISADYVMVLVGTLNSLGLSNKSVFVSFDKIHANASCATAQDFPSSTNKLERRNYVFGPKTNDDLSGARLECGDIPENKAHCDEKDLATGFVTIKVGLFGASLISLIY